MAAIDGALLCLGYVLGLLLTGLPGQVQGWPIGSGVALLLGAIAAVMMPRVWRTGPCARLWVLAGCLGMGAALYFQMKLPREAPTDLSQWVQSAETLEITTNGVIHSPPQLTRSQRIQFELAVDHAKKTDASEEIVTGTVYVTVPLLQGTGLYPGDTILVTGQLYRPKPAANPGGFDFQAYLAQQGIFAGLNGKTVERGNPRSRPTLTTRFSKPLAQIRQRIVRSQINGLGTPEGTLVSVMVLGRNGVDLPYAIKDQFVAVGLAHALAASGAQVSMLVGVMVALTRPLPALWRGGLSSSILLLYVGLAGCQPAVLRAAFMGFAAIWALTMERKTNPLGLVLFTATFLLVCNPIWIWDLGFQLSFLATLGLLVTAPAITRWLDWMPSAISPLFAIPIAAYLWTLPLQLSIFGVVSPYTIPVNVITTPLIMVLSIGGMVSASVGLVSLPLGSLVAQALYLPAHALLALVDWSTRLPGMSFAIGSLSSLQVVLLYSLYLIPVCPRLYRRFWFVTAAAIVLIIMMPLAMANGDRPLLTVLSTDSEAVMVVQTGRQVGLINSGEESDVQFTVLPFLQRRGVNQLDWAIALTPTPAWLRIVHTVSIQDFYGALQIVESAAAKTLLDLQNAISQIPSHTLSLDKPIAADVFQAQPLSLTPTIVQFQIADQHWLLLQAVSDSVIPSFEWPQADVLWWSGQEPTLPILNAVQPKVAIASARRVSQATQDAMQSLGSTLFITGRDGAIQWSPNQGFKTVLAIAEP